MNGERRKRRAAEAKERGLTLREWLAERREIGLVPTPSDKPTKEPAMSKKAMQLAAVKSDLKMSEAARQLSEREKALAKRYQPIIASIPCPKLRYSNMELADAALRRILAERTEDLDEYLHAYPCLRCGGAHLGHSSPLLQSVEPVERSA